MSTITDAVEKKRREDEAKKPKELDLEHPPNVSMPRDSRGMRRLAWFLVVLIIIGCAAGAGFYYRKELGDYISTLIPKRIGGSPKTNVVIDDTSTTKETSHGTPSGEEKTEENVSVPEEEYIIDEFPQLNISGIIFDPLDPEAIVNGQSVKTGETIDGAYIVEIRRDSIRFRYKGEERVLSHR